MSNDSWRAGVMVVSARRSASGFKSGQPTIIGHPHTALQCRYQALLFFFTIQLTVVLCASRVIAVALTVVSEFRAPPPRLWEGAETWFPFQCREEGKNLVPFVPSSSHSANDPRSEGNLHMP